MIRQRERLRASSWTSATGYCLRTTCQFPVWIEPVAPIFVENSPLMESPETMPRKLVSTSQEQLGSV